MSSYSGLGEYGCLTSHSAEPCLVSACRSSTRDRRSCIANRAPHLPKKDLKGSLNIAPIFHLHLVSATYPLTFQNSGRRNRVQKSGPAPKNVVSSLRRESRKEYLDGFVDSVSYAFSERNRVVPAPRSPRNRWRQGEGLQAEIFKQEINALCGIIAFLDGSFDRRSLLAHFATWRRSQKLALSRWTSDADPCA